MLPATLQTLAVGVVDFCIPLSLLCICCSMQRHSLFKNIYLDALIVDWQSSTNQAAKFKTSTRNLLSVSYNDFWFPNHFESFNDHFFIVQPKCLIICSITKVMIYWYSLSCNKTLALSSRTKRPGPMLCRTFSL